MRRARKARRSRPPARPRRPSRAARRGESPPADERLRAGARQILGRDLTEEETESVFKYLKLLTKWDRVHRLVGFTESSWLIDNVILDSLLFLRVLPEGTRSVGDLGSGAGIPGIPMKIVRPDLGVLLIEARRRRASFLSTVVRELGLGGIEVVNERAEALASHRDGSLDVVVARCAGTPAEISMAALPLLKPGGVVIVSGSPGGLLRAKDVVTGFERAELAGIGGKLRRFWTLRKI